MVVRQNPRLGKADIEALIDAAISPFADQFDSYLTSIVYGRPMSPEREPAYQAFLSEASLEAMSRALLENHIEGLVHLLAQQLPSEAEVDPETLGRVVRALLKKRTEQLAEQVETLKEMADNRPVPQPPADNLTIHAVVEFDPGPELGERIRKEGLTAKEGEISPLHEELTRRVDEEIAAGRYLTGAQYDAQSLRQRQTPTIAGPQLAPGTIIPMGPVITKVWGPSVQHLILDKTWTEGSDKHANAALAMLVSVCGDRPLDAYTVADGARLQSIALRLPSQYTKDKRWAAYLEKGDLEGLAAEADRLAADGKADFTRRTAKTWNSDLAKYNAVWRMAHKKGLANSPDCPFASFFIDVKKGKAKQETDDRRRDMLHEDDLRLLFGDALFTSAPAQPCNGKDEIDYWFERHWGILTGAHHGFRLGEIFQLKVRHVKWADDVCYFDLQTNDGWLDLKEEGSRRLVPVHAQMLKLGFLEDCVIGRHPEELLFSRRPVTGKVKTDRIVAEAVANALGKFFGRLKKGLGFSSRQTFHSLRHTFQFKLESEDVKGSFISALMGHKDRSRPAVSSVYSHGIPVKKLKPKIDLVSIPINVKALLKARGARGRR